MERKCISLIDEERKRLLITEKSTMISIILTSSPNYSALNSSIAANYSVIITLCRPVCGAGGTPGKGALWTIDGNSEKCNS